MTSFYTIKRSTPEFFANRDVQSEEIQQCLENQEYFYLPVTSDNQSLIFHKVTNTDAKSYHFDNAAKTMMMTTENCLYSDGPRAGVIYLFDLKDIGLSFLLRPSISSIRKGIKFLEEGSPINITAVHILNVVPFMHLIIRMVRPFCMSDLINRVHTYKTFKTPQDLEEFHKNVIHKSNLPSDYGGDLEATKYLHQKHCEQLMSMRDYFYLEEEQTNFKFDRTND